MSDKLGNYTLYELSGVIDEIDRERFILSAKYYRDPGLDTVVVFTQRFPDGVKNVSRPDNQGCNDLANSRVSRGASRDTRDTELILTRRGTQNPISFHPC